MDLGPHAFYIVAAYAVTALILAGLVLRAVLDHRAQTRALSRFSDRGVARRSDSGEHFAGARRDTPSELRLPPSSTQVFR